MLSLTKCRIILHVVVAIRMFAISIVFFSFWRNPVWKVRGSNHSFSISALIFHHFMAGSLSKSSAFGNGNGKWNQKHFAGLTRCETRNLLTRQQFMAIVLARPTKHWILQCDVKYLNCAIHSQIKQTSPPSLFSSAEYNVLLKGKKKLSPHVSSSAAVYGHYCVHSIEKMLSVIVGSRILKFSAWRASPIIRHSDVNSRHRPTNHLPDNTIYHFMDLLLLFIDV